MSANTVLFLTRELPYPPNAGDRIVTYGYLQGLAERGHEVHVLTYRSNESLADVAALRESCKSITRIPGTSSRLPPAARKVVRAALGRSDVMSMFDSSALHEAAVRRITAVQPDVIIAQHPYIGQVFCDKRVRRAARKVDARLVTSAHVVEYAAHERHREYADDRMTQLELALEIPRLRRDELAVYRASDQTVVLGQEDERRLLRQDVGHVSRERVGLNVERYNPAPLDSSSERRDRLVFFGSYDWFPNEDAAITFTRKVFPRIRRAHPDAELVLAGRGATDSVRLLGEAPGVTFRGEVDDLESFVHDAAVVIAPLRVGGGVRIKVLESMAWRRPVVTTRQGFEGVEATPGDDLLVADDLQSFVESTLALLRNADERERIATNARETIAEQYAINDVAADLEAALGLDRPRAPERS